jgi:hypothetical protein
VEADKLLGEEDKPLGYSHQELDIAVDDTAAVGKAVDTAVEEYIEAYIAVVDMGWTWYYFNIKKKCLRKRRRRREKVRGRPKIASFHWVMEFQSLLVRG